jgi:predicted lipid-binding transport protein (Tim44 family)
MRHVISCLLIGLLSFGLFVNEAAAKRFGGGRSMGVQRSYNSMFSSNKTTSKSTLGQNVNKNKWGGMLGGLLVGGLLATLFMGHGFASGIMSWLILGVAAYFIINLLRRRQQPVMQSTQDSSFKQNTFNPFNQYYSGSGSSSSTGSASVTFDTEAFLRNAKICFIRLQAAYDQKNLEDLKAFTLPEVYAEIKMQLEERGNELNQTEVINLNAELLDVTEQSYSSMASVRFTGTLKENNEQTQLDEIWHFRQLDKGQDWLVGGIQQEVYKP